MWGETQGRMKALLMEKAFLHAGLSGGVSRSASASPTAGVPPRAALVPTSPGDGKAVSLCYVAKYSGAV